jgi:hypothetical protein
VAPFVCGEGGSLRDFDFVLWEMALATLLQLYHWKLRAADIWTIEPAAPVTLQAQRLAAFDHADECFQA